MGHFVHHTIVVTAKGVEKATSFYAKAKEIFGWESVSPPMPSPANEFRSFMVIPDGGKSGLSNSRLGDERRARFVEWLRLEGGADWVLLSYGGDNPEFTKVEGHNGVDLPDDVEMEQWKLRLKALSDEQRKELRSLFDEESDLVKLAFSRLATEETVHRSECLITQVTGEWKADDQRKNWFELKVVFTPKKNLKEA